VTEPALGGNPGAGFFVAVRHTVAAASVVASRSACRIVSAALSWYDSAVGARAAEAANFFAKAPAAN